DWSSDVCSSDLFAHHTVDTSVPHLWARGLSRNKVFARPGRRGADLHHLSWRKLYSYSARAPRGVERSCRPYDGQSELGPPCELVCRRAPELPRPTIPLQSSGP